MSLKVKYIKENKMELREEQYRTMQYDKGIMFELANWIELNVGGWVEIDYKYTKKIGNIIVRECTEDEIELLIEYEKGLSHLVRGEG